MRPAVSFPRRTVVEIGADCGAIYEPVWKLVEQEATGTRHTPTDGLAGEFAVEWAKWDRGRISDEDLAWWVTENRDSILTALSTRTYADGLGDAITAAANVGYLTCAKTRHVSLGEQVRSEITALRALKDKSND